MQVAASMASHHDITAYLSSQMFQSKMYVPNFVSSTFFFVSFYHPRVLLTQEKILLRNYFSPESGVEWSGGELTIFYEFCLEDDH